MYYTMLGPAALHWQVPSRRTFKELWPHMGLFKIDSIQARGLIADD